MAGTVKVPPDCGGRLDAWRDQDPLGQRRHRHGLAVRRPLPGGPRKWKTWKNDTASFHAAFGHNDRPVNFRPNRHNYKLKVRSERRRVKKRSDWSPVLRFG